MTTKNPAQSLTTLLYNEFPDMKGKSMRYIAQGYDNHVLLVDDTYIFRIARNDTRNFSTEIKLLQTLSQYISTRTPEPTYIGSDYSCMGYVKIPGKQLSGNILHTCSPKQQEILSRQLAQFIRNLHEVITQEPERNERLLHRSKTQNFMNNIATMSLDRFDSLARDRYQSLTAQRDSYHIDTSESSILHHDLYSNNIFVNTKDNSLAGIIDFSDVSIGNIHEDFMFLMFENPNFAQKVARSYEQQSNEKIAYSTLHLYASIFALHEYIHANPDNYQQAKRWLSDNRAIS